MFGIFRKKNSDPFRQLAENFVGPIAKAVAITELVAEYARGVNDGTIDYPAHRREQKNVPHIWNDVRLEAFEKMFNFGTANLSLLADRREERSMLAALETMEPQLRLSEPVGTPHTDTLLAVWRVYEYLDAVGTDVGDASTDRHLLNARGVSIFDKFISKSDELRSARQRYAASSSEPMPATLMDILYDDVTSKTKSIAMSAVFGPNPESGITYMLGLIAKEGKPKDVEFMKASVAKLRAAREPEDC